MPIPEAEQNRVRAELEAGKYEPFLREIRFPLYKNLESGTRISFTYPITAIVGPNGTNKTSILRAIEACPDYVSLENYWFSTTLDPIDSAVRYRYIHSYRAPSGTLIESVKTRISREGRPEAWEPSRPLLNSPDNMKKMPGPKNTPAEDQKVRTQTRWKAIDKKVVYVDFRHNIPAFDLYYHFDFGREVVKPSTKKNRLRTRARPLSEVLNSNLQNFSYYSKEQVVSGPKELDEEALTWISKVLGREYVKVELVQHTLYYARGFTVRLQSADLNYSEAFAGSGEFAAVMLIKSVLEAKPGSLIILDEPEVSLHPSAQHQIMEFIRIQSMKSKHQVVIASHSGEIIRDLPPDAIKVLTLSQSTGRCMLLSQDCLPSEALKRIGIEGEGHKIFVEDSLAKEVVDYSVTALGDGFESVMVEYLGGADLIMSHYVPLLARLNFDCLVLLDGDQAPSSELRSGEETPPSEVFSELKKVGIDKKHLGLSGGNDKSEGRGTLVAQQLLSWIKTHVRYLPEQNPEEWLIRASGAVADDSADPKQYWKDCAERELVRRPGLSVSSSDILTIQRLALKRVKVDDRGLDEIMKLIQEFVGAEGGIR